MLTENGVFIFTKNRDTLLKRGCSNILPSDHGVWLIDDSSDEDIREINETFCKEKQIHYYGIKEQDCLIESLQLKGYKANFFLKRLGDGQWNLGYARNHALVLAASKKLKKVLFLDDDILVDSPSNINSLFLALDDNDFVGSKIVGMPDDSILGHVADQIGINFKRMCSGGCLAFRTDVVNHYFLNMYNEDWIWLYLHSLSSRQKEFGEAWQATYEVFENYENTVLFQEIGEIAVDGVADAVSLENVPLIKLEKYWEQKFTERKEYLILLKKQCEKNNQEKASKILDWILGNYPKWTPKELAQVFVDYFFGRESFTKLYRELLLP